VIARVIENVRADTLVEFVREAVSHKVSLLCTDQWRGYRKLDKEYPHATIDHSKGQYVIGAVHTQTIEGFWSIFKRGVMGTFHKMSAKYMPLYVAEFQFRITTAIMLTSSEQQSRDAEPCEFRPMQKSSAQFLPV
jgi:hypothetical protein